MPSFSYDAFISHAVEDKLPIANELCARLEQAGLKIWYSGHELRPGDCIAERIEEGLNTSRYGIVIFTPTYVSKVWALREFFALLELEKLGRKKILPVLHGIKPTELAARGLEIEDRFMISTDRGLDHVVERLALQIKRPTITVAPRYDSKTVGAITFAVVMALLLAFYWIGLDHRLGGETPPAVDAGNANAAYAAESENTHTVIVNSSVLSAEEEELIKASIGTSYPELADLIDRDDVVIEHRILLPAGPGRTPRAAQRKLTVDSRQLTVRAR